MVFFPASDKAIRYCGRVALSSEECRFDWPGVEVRFAVTGATQVHIHMDGARNYFNLVVAGKSSVLVTEPGNTCYPIDLDPNQQTTMHLYKRTEAIAGYPDGRTGCVIFKGIELDAGRLIADEAPARRVIEVVGDSDTAAFGNLGSRAESKTAVSCPPFQDVSQSWGAFTAQAFGADCHNISFSGMGAVWNAPGLDRPAMNEHYKQLLVSSPEQWTAKPNDNTLPHADLVILYIGGNDWWTLTDRGDNDFIEGYVRFLRELRALRPAQPFLILLADEASGSCLVTRDRQRLFSDDMKRVLGEIVRAVDGEQNSIYLREVVPEPAIDVEDDADWGLAEHWSVQGNRKWANGVIPLVAEVTGWPC